MAEKANFEIIRFASHLGDNVGDLPTNGVTWEGDSVERTFEIEGHPVGSAYLTLQLYDVDSYAHSIKINGKDLSGPDMRPNGARQWSAWPEVIGAGFLRHGKNTIRIERNRHSTDNFVVDYVFVHWKERL